MKLVKEEEIQGFDLTLRVANPNGTGVAKYQFQPKAGSSNVNPYFVMDVELANAGFGEDSDQTITFTVFDLPANAPADTRRSKYTQRIVDDLTLPAGVLIDHTTGKFTAPTKGRMVELFYGMPVKRSFTPKGMNAPISTTSSSEVVWLPKGMTALKAQSSLRTRVKKACLDPNDNSYNLVFGEEEMDEFEQALAAAGDM